MDAALINELKGLEDRMRDASKRVREKIAVRAFGEYGSEVHEFLVGLSEDIEAVADAVELRRVDAGVAPQGAPGGQKIVIYTNERPRGSLRFKTNLQQHWGYQPGSLYVIGWSIRSERKYRFVCTIAVGPSAANALLADCDSLRCFAMSDNVGHLIRTADRIEWLALHEAPDEAINPEATLNG